MSACLLMWCFQLRTARCILLEFSCFLTKGHQWGKAVHNVNVKECVSGTGAEHEAV